ncbi:nucleotidyl transferase AbiEii/AbiGii toxin family protein [Rhodococcus sp. SJ-3]|uniref:nucleotidyl transferase AbiEii/AbiGii toxin family protein n=1 Tax=Rhodococcus sp. SJ-3 TaxID=3454628 RepID=UPI003F7AF162
MILDEQDAVAAQFGVAPEQVERDHLIAHLLTAIVDRFADRVHFIGGTALARTHLPSGRLSEDIDLVALGNRNEMAAELDAVLERAAARTHDRDIQRIGQSATVGNPDESLAWLQGSAIGRPRRVVAPDVGAPATDPDITVDYVGSVSNAATVIASLHQGEKRLAFVDSRRRAGELGAALHDRGITNAVSGLKFSAALPPGLAEQTLAKRLGDEQGARAALEVPRTIFRRFD